MIKRYSQLNTPLKKLNIVAFTKDEHYLNAVRNKDFALAKQMLQREARSKGFHSKPFYHGTLSNWVGHTFKSEMQFFSDAPEFAERYAEQKAIEQGLDEDIKVKSFYLAGNIFDANNPVNIKKLSPHLPDTIHAMGYFGLGGNFSKEEWLKAITGDGFSKVMFTDKDLENLPIGGGLPDNELQGKPIKYQYLGRYNNQILYATANTIEKIERAVEEGYLTKGKFTREDILSDLRKLSLQKMDGWRPKDAWFQAKYKLGFHVYAHSTPSVPTLYKGYYDTWILFETDPAVIKAMFAANFKIIKMLEKRNVTYATLRKNIIKSTDVVTYDDNGEIIPLSKRFNLSKTDIRY